MLKVAGILTVFGLALAAPLSAQDAAPRPSPREGPDTTCGPNYGSKPFADSGATRAADTGRVVTRDTRPPCNGITNPAVTIPIPAPPANAQVAPLSAKADSLRQQSDSTSRRPKN